MSNTRNSNGMINSDCVRSTQVDDQMISIGASLDTLSAVSEELIRRLEIVTSAGPASTGAVALGGGSIPLVPLASRLSNVQARINCLTDVLRSTLDNLEV